GVTIWDLKHAGSAITAPRTARGGCRPDRRRGTEPSQSAIRAVVDRAGRRRAWLERRNSLRTQLLDVRRTAIEVVDPLAEPRLDGSLVARDPVPVEVEPVVAVVRPLDVRRMRPERLHDDRIDDEPGDDRAVRVRLEPGFVRDVLDEDYDAIGGERRVLLTAEEAPVLGGAGGVGALGMDDRDVRLERRHRVQHAVAVRGLDFPDQRVGL